MGRCPACGEGKLFRGFAKTVDEVIGEAFENLANGPTWIVGENTRAGIQMLGSLPRNDAVRLMMQASAAAMGEG